MRSYLSFRVKGIVLSALCGLIFVVPAFSQDKPSVAVMPFIETNMATYGGADLTDMLTKELVASGKFSVADKAKAAAVEPELKRGPKDTVDPTSAAEVGRKTGAQFLVLGNVTEYGEKIKVTLTGVKSYDAIVKFKLSAVNTATGEVVFSQTIEKRGVSMGEAKNITGTYISKGMQDAIKNSLKEAVSSIVKNLASPAAK